MGLVSSRIQHVYQLLDPGQHDELSQFDAAFRQDNTVYRVLSTDDPSFFHGRSVIFNRATRLHTDNRDPKPNLTPVLTLGTYETGTMSLPTLNMRFPYNPGTLAMVRGAIIPHEVSFDGGQRVAIAHFMHQTILSGASRPLVPQFRPYARPEPTSRGRA